ncbi:hypothetical protein FPCIR_5920 [Fusarium pseudocircinatum]|uniref:Uncharacterized protein n=1 Tax=Fusarium pseudocircinatum TaxID=56676 RepID=A0A8H5P888_9HYPO|nr:hypothetical protein FPCIR_5920 [Fusarium pseudocircinatum]
MPPKPPKGGETLGGILFGGTLYAIMVSGLASLLENTNDNNKDIKEEPKQAEPKPTGPNWLQKRLKEPGYYKKQVQEEFKEFNDKLNAEQPKYDITILELNPYLLGQQFQRFRQDNPGDVRVIWTEYDLYYFTLCPVSASEEGYPLE